MKNDCSAYLINGNGANLESFEFKLAATTVKPKSTCPSAYIQDVQPQLTLTISDSLENSMAFEDIRSGNEFNLVLPLYDINGNKKAEIVVPKAVPIEDNGAVDSGRVTITRTFELRKVNGDDNFEIKYYA
jgi:hypothetical protein